MLLRHSTIYLLARGVPGLIGFAAIAIYTRLLSPEAYGQYALVVTGAVLINAILYQWLSASLLRFFPQHQNNPAELFTTILIGFTFASFLTGAVGAVLAMVWWDSVWGGLIVIGIFLTWAQAWFSINLELVRSRLAPARYGAISLVKSVIALGLGLLLVIWGLDAYGALIGLLFGFSFAGIWASWRQWGILKGRGLNRKLVSDLLAYGLPITASLALTVVITSTDRFMLAGLINEAATGLYAASQGLAQQSVGVLMTMVNLAAYPLIIQSFEKSGPEAARAQLRKNAILLLGIGLPTATGFMLLAPNMAKVFLGIQFQSTGIELIPWIAVATLLAGVRAYYLDLAFYLGKRTRLQVMVMTSAALLNVVLNFWLIPVFGLLGAAYATVAAHGLAMMLSFILGRRAFLLPALHGDIARLLASTLVMAVVLHLLPEGEGVLRLILSIAAGGVAYLGCLLVFNLGGVRDITMHFLTHGMSVWKEIMTR